MAEQAPTVGMERKLAAIFSTDVAGYSRLMGEDEEATIRTLTAYRGVISSVIQQYRGRVVDAPGDNLLAEFASVVDAVRCAVEIQQTLKIKNAALLDQRQMHFRIGINLGDVIVEGERLYGDGVNIAARLESLAIPGGICISGTVYDHVENKLALTYDYQGEQTVKNIAKPVRVYRVGLEPSPAPQPTLSGEQPSLLPLPDKPSLAVLPFTNLSSDPEQEYFSDGLTEDLITDLSRLSGLFVIARHSTFAYKGTAVKVQEVSRDLGVRYVLEGSVRKAGERVRITAQLIEASTGHHLWAERYDRPLQDIFALQDEIVQKIVTTLKLQLSLWEQGHLVRKTTANLEAYDYYLRGVEYFYRLTQETNVQARQLFEQALALDPQYAEAYARLGWSCLIGWISQWDQASQTLEQAFALAQQAVALDDSLPLAHRVLGWVALWKKQHEQAIAAAERAVALAPNDAEGYARLGEILNFAGRPVEAIGWVEKALRLNPRSPFHYSFYLGHAYRLTGRYEEAIAALKRALTRNPDYLPVHENLAAVYSELGREAEARAEVAEVLRLSPHRSLEAFRQRLPHKDPAVTERYLAALRKAGLK
jgi:TolB-like protein/class 3 adenylate cyclase/Flp pilus assembly protein TadD